MFAVYTKEFLEEKKNMVHRVSTCLREVPCRMECKIYYDRGYRSDIRDPEFYKMIKEIEEGNIKRLIIFSIEDIKEHLFEKFNIIRLFENYGLSVLFVKEEIDTGSIIGRAKYQTLAYMDIIS